MTNARAALIALAAALAAGAAWWWWMRHKNALAFLALIRKVESEGRYDVIAGGDTFTDYSEHPFIREPARRKPLGTTAAGAYQLVRQTWIMARDALALTDFSRASQDAAALWILQYKIPGEWNVIAAGTGNLELVEEGRFDEAIARLELEWEAFQKMRAGRYPMTLEEARAFLEASGAVFA